MAAPVAPKNALTVRLSDAELAALDRYLRETGIRGSREEALAAIFARWAGEQGLLPNDRDEDGLEPDELNASNDG